MACKTFQSSLAKLTTHAEIQVKELQEIKQIIESRLSKLESYSPSTRIRLVDLLSILFCFNCGEVYDDACVSAGDYLCQCQD